MNFILAERFGLKYLIIENTYPNEYWTLEVRPYYWTFSESRPRIADLDGMTIKVISDKEGLEILKPYADDNRHNIKAFIERYEALPF